MKFWIEVYWCRLFHKKHYVNTGIDIICLKCEPWFKGDFQ